MWTCNVTSQLPKEICGGQRTAPWDICFSRETFGRYPSRKCECLTPSPPTTTCEEKRVVGVGEETHRHDETTPDGKYLHHHNDTRWELGGKGDPNEGRAQI